REELGEFFDEPRLPHPGLALEEEDLSVARARAAEERRQTGDIVGAPVQRRLVGSASSPQGLMRRRADRARTLGPPRGALPLVEDGRQFLRIRESRLPALLQQTRDHF